MHTKRSKSCIIYRLITLLVGIAATILTITDHLGPDSSPTMLFFTTWSVWFATLAGCLAFFNAVSGKPNCTAYSAIKFCASIMIIATFIVAGFVLPSKLWTASYWTLGGALKHFFLPILTVLDCFLFDNRGEYKPYFPLLGGVAPLTYWIVIISRFSAFRASCGGAIPSDLWYRYYPYGFTNCDNGHTLKGLCIMLAGILVGLILIGFAIYFAKRPKKSK